LASDRAIVEQFGKKHGYEWKDNQIDALTSFVYNLGPQALAQVTANGTRSLEELPEFMKLYFNAGGKKLKGLEKRRNAEADWYNS
jgi:GH24 family phage-related lysozyme (muramidase)